MATSVMMASDPNTDISMALPEDNDNQPIQRSRRRKPKGGESCAAQKKKQPQRGMGVAQLERLRLQERWKKMTEINTTTQTLNFVATSFANPSFVNVSAPVQFSKLGGFGAPNVTVGQMGLNPNQGFFGFDGQIGLGGLVSDQFQENMFGVAGSNNSGYQVKSVSEPSKSKELSSTLNFTKCYPENCSACHKKKRVNGENLGCGRVKSDNGGCEFLGLNGQEQNININQENQILRTTAPLVPHVAHAFRKGQPGVAGVEVVAVHRKGSLISSQDETMVMEYEFFPSGKGNRSKSHNDGCVMMKLMGQGSETAIGDQTCCGSTATGFDASTSSIDLSLKLSY